MAVSLLGALKAVAAGAIAGAGAILLAAGVNPDLVAVIVLVLAPLAVYLTPNVE